MAERVIKNKPVLYVGTEQTNPTTSTVMADTGALATAGIYEFLVYLSATAAAHFEIQHRNAANDATTKALIIYAAAGQTGCYPVRFDLAAGERVRVMMNDNLTGGAVAAINAEKLG